MQSLTQTKQIISLFLLLLMFHLNTFAHREKTYALYGTFGENKVALEIIDVDGYWSGRYFYINDKNDHYLLAECDTNYCELVSKIFDKELNKEIILEKIIITEDSSYNWHGFQYLNDDTLVIDLKPLKIDQFNHNYKNKEYVDNLNPYSYYKIHDLEFTKPKKEKKAKGLYLKKTTEKRSGIELFYIDGKSVKENAARVNNVLEKEFLQDILNSFSCSSMGYIGKYNQSLALSLYNNKVISYTKNIISNCQGNYENQNSTFKNLNFAESTFMQLEDVFYLDTIQEKPRYGSQQFFKYRYNLFNVEMLKILRKLYPDQINDEHCNFSSNKAWQFPKWLITPEGILFYSSSTSVNKDCRENTAFLIPYKGHENYFDMSFFE